MGYYQAGDYYRGDYYRGDPGLLGDIWKGVKKIGTSVVRGAIGTITGGPIAGIKSAIGSFVAPPAPSFSMGPPLPDLQQQYGVINVQTGVQPSMSLTPSGALVPCQMKGYRVNKSGYYRHPRGNPAAAVYVPPKSVCVKTRRLNVANPRALRRAIRRAQGFAKLARRVMTFVSAKAPKGRAKFKKKR